MRPSQTPLSLTAKVFIASVLGFITILAFLSGNPLLFLQASIVGLLPAAVAVYVVLRLGDEQLSKSFLVEQLFFGGVLAYLAVFAVELILSAVGLGTIFYGDIHQFLTKNKALFDHLKNTPNNRAVLLSELIKAAMNISPWKVVVFALFLAFVVAATVEESSKLIVGQRAKRLLPGGSRDCNLSPHSMVAAVVAGALGFAATEHFFFTLPIFRVFARMPNSYLITIGPILLSLFRALLAFPVHMGTALLFGVAMAKKLILRQQVRVLWAFLLAVAFHGTFDAVAIVTLFYFRVVPKWVVYSVPVIQIVLTIILVVVCRRSYKSLSSEVFDGYESVHGDIV